MCRFKCIGLFLICLSMYQYAHGQQILEIPSQNISSFSGNAIEDDVYIFNPSDQAISDVNRITSIIGIESNFELFAANVPHTASALLEKRRLILYSEFFMSELSLETGNDLAALSILAHEIGHHLNGHLFKATNSKELELEADMFSGYIMERLGASLQEAQWAVLKLAPKDGTASYPALQERLHAVKSGWTEARNQNPIMAVFPGSNSNNIPKFPWPPPQASASMTLSNELFGENGSIPLLGDIDNKLLEALEFSGYFEKSYFAIPDGFVIVTRLEQTYADGTPKEIPERWSVEPATLSLKNFSLREYISKIFLAPKGYYRIIAFLVTPNPFTYSDATISREEANDWIVSGLNRLPDQISKKQFSAKYRVTVLVYEFVSDADEQDALKVPGRLSGKTHLEKSRILDIFGRK